MRRLPFVLLLIAVAISMTACCGQPPSMRLQAPALDVPPPISFYQPPNIQPTGYAQVVQAPMQVQYQPLQTYGAPCAPAPSYAAPAPTYSTPYYWAPPPVQTPAPAAAGAPCR